MDSMAATPTWGWIVLVGFLLLGVLFGGAVIAVFVAAFFHGMKNPHPAAVGGRARPVASPAVERSGPGYKLLVFLWTLGLIVVAVLAAGYAVTYPDGFWLDHSHHHFEEFLLVFGSLIGILLMALTVARLVWINRKRWAAALTYARPAAGRSPAAAVERRSPSRWLVWAGLLVAGVVFAIWYVKTEVVSAPAEKQLAMTRVGVGTVALVAMGLGAAFLRFVFRRSTRTVRELDTFLNTVPRPPLTPHQRRTVFWAFALVMLVGLFVLLWATFSEMRFSCLSIGVALFIASSFATTLFTVSDWAFRPKAADGGVSPPPVLPVAPLLLTPDPTPAGSCPTCGGPIPPGSPHGLCPRCLIRGAFPSPSVTVNRPVRPIDPPPPAEVGEFFPHLEVLELIGAGGMGAVYKARQPNLDRVVALKVVQAPSGADDPVFAERFAREARAMAKLDHPNVVTIHESGEAGGLPYLVMEYVDGITLREAMANKVLTTAEALAVIPQVCDALDYAHRNGVVHRDIKPENILIDQAGRVKIADFGLAKLADPNGPSLTHTRQAMGTPHYMAPEQWEKPTAVDHRADIYALGVVLYELLTGELPLGRFDLPSAKGKGDAKLDRVVLRALAKEPGQRYQHASDLKNELSRVGRYAGVSQLNTSRSCRPYSEYRSKKTFLGWPLVHVVRGKNPATGMPPVAKGWVAVSDGAAIGGIAIGAVSAVGVISVGGLFSLGLLAVGGVLGIGLFALGGVAIGLLFAAGGVAVAAGLAVGGAAVGQFAIGGATVGQYTLGGTRDTPGFGNALGNSIRGLFGWL